MWTIRAFEERDEPALLALFARVFGREISAEQYRWKLRSHRLLIDNIFVAVDGDKPIFQYAGIPIRYQLAGRERLAMLSVDTMASPDYRRQGLLTTVGKYTYNQWREQGVDFVIGLPNEQWGSRAQALGWQPLFPLAWYSLPLRPSQILGRKVPFVSRMGILDHAWRLRWRRKIAAPVVPVSKMNADFYAKSDERYAPIRDAAWFKWRYLDCPQPYEVNKLMDGRIGGTHQFRDGGIAFRISAETAIIAECSGDHWEDLLQTALQKAFSAGATTITTQAVPDSQFALRLEKAGFRRRPHEFGVQIVPLADDLPPLTDLQNPRNWNLCGGDFDIL